MKTSFHLTAIAASFAMTSLCHAGNLTVVVTDKDGRAVPDAVVVVLPSNKQVLPKTPLPREATISQEKMQFIPLVSLVAVGAKIKLVNNDPWNHHIKSSPAGLDQFNTSKVGFETILEGKPEGKTAKAADITLDGPGVVAANALGCYLHGSMRGYLFVSDAPWTLKTGANGTASFEDLPEGPAQIKVWQADQLVDLQPQTTQIGTTSVSNTFQLNVNPRRRRNAI